MQEVQDAKARLYETFKMDSVDKALNKRVEQQQKALEEQQAAMAAIPQPVDIYQRNKDRMYEVSQKSFPKGSSRAVDMSVYAVVDGVGTEGLAKAYKRAQDDIDALEDQGERGRANIRRQQYMQENFLPAVEIVVNSTSPDEVLANQKALQELDKYALVSTGASGKGYTATYIRQAYGNQLGQQEGRSDASVRSEVMRINSLLDEGQIRTAVGIANKLKDKIDKGEAMADDVDYDLLGRVVSFYK